MGQGSLLHVGCGNGPLPDWMAGFKETRLDINASCNPDIVASMVDMGDIGEFDVVFSQHALEHVYPHEVPKTLSEFHRVLKPAGHAIVVVPDLEDVTPTDDVLFESVSGPIAGLDLIYGFRVAIEEHPHMAHHCGFTSASLKAAFNAQGFRKVETQRFFPYNLMAVAVK